MILHSVLLIHILLCSVGSYGEQQANESDLFFKNPIVESGADPWVVQRDGSYFYCYSRRNCIWVSRAEHLEDIGKAMTAAVWTPPEDAPYSKELWAPELHYLRGKWYIYVAADDGDNFNHRMYVLEGTSQNPQAPFIMKGKITDSKDRWAIDGTVLETADQNVYFIWSGWEGAENVQQNLYIAPMSDPWTISGERVCLSKPGHEWETHGNPLINEGPEVLKNGDKVFIIYSASGSWTDEYCLGQITLIGENVLDPASWEKKAEPVFTRTDTVFGPGHASFVKSENGKEDWIVYHSAKHSGAGWNRQVCIQPFTWNIDGSPNFGRPVLTNVSIPIPQRD